MITYKTFTPENMELFINNKNFFSAAVEILGFDSFNSEKLELKTRKFKEGLLKKDRYVFLAIENKQILGLTSGFLKNKTFFTDYLYVRPFHQNKHIGVKLKLRSAAYLFSKKKIGAITSMKIIHPKIFSINKHIVNRVNKSTTRAYAHKHVIDKNTPEFVNPKNTFSIFPKTKIKHGKK